MITGQLPPYDDLGEAPECSRCTGVLSRHRRALALGVTPLLWAAIFTLGQKCPGGFLIMEAAAWKVDTQASGDINAS